MKYFRNFLTGTALALLVSVFGYLIGVLISTFINSHTDAGLFGAAILICGIIGGISTFIHIMLKENDNEA